MTLIGYARVSVRSQKDDSQIAELTKAGCAKIFTDQGKSGKLASRPQLDACLAYLADGDTLVITRLSRAMRSMRHLLDLSAELDRRNINLMVLKQNIDTRTATGRLLFHILGAFDEFLREIIVEGTVEGLATAKANGKQLGAAPRDPRRVRAVREMFDGGASPTDIAKSMRMARPTVYRHLDESDATAGVPWKSVKVPRGRSGGRKPTLTPAQEVKAQELIDAGKTVKDTAGILGVSRATVYRHLDASKEDTTTASGS